MSDPWHVWSRDDDHVVCSYGSLCLNAYSRPYRLADAELFVDINKKLWATFPLVSSLNVVDTTSWGIAELRMLRDEPTRAKLSLLRDELPDTGTLAIVLVGNGIAAAFAKSLAYGFQFISKSRRAGMFSDIKSSVSWLDEHLHGHVAFPSAPQVQTMIDSLDHRTLRF